VNHGPELSEVLEQLPEHELADVSGRLGSRAAPATQSRYWTWSETGDDVETFA